MTISMFSVRPACSRPRILPALLTLIIFPLLLVQSALATSYTSVASGNWSNTAVWGGTVPTVGADVTITNGNTVTISSNVVNSPGTLTIASGSQLTVGGYNLSVMGATTVNGTLLHNAAAGTHSYTGDVTIASGGVWTETVAAATVSFGGNLTINNGGSMTEFGAAIRSCAGNMQNDGTFTASTGIHTFSGTGKTFNGANAIVIPNVTITGTYENDGTLAVSTSLAGIGGLTQGPNAILNLGTAITLTTLNAAAYVNSVSYTGAAQTVKGVTYGNLTLIGTGAKSLASLTTIIGDLTLTGTTVSATTAANLSIGGNLMVGTGTTFTVAGYNFTVAGLTAVSGTLSHTSATGLKTFTGDVTIYSGGTWSETATGVTSVIAGNLRNDGTLNAAFNTNGVHTFTGTGKTFSGANVVALPCVTMSGTYTNTGTLTVSNALAGAGTLTQGANSILNIAAPTVALATLDAASNVNLVNYTNVAQTVKAIPYYHLNLSGAGTKDMTAVTAIGGDLTLSGSATLISNAVMTIGGALNYRTSGASTLTNNVTGAALTITNGTLTLGAGLTHTFTGAWTRIAGTVLAGSSTLRIGGSVSGTGGVFTAGTGTVEWNGAGDQTLAALTYNNLILSGGGAKVMGAGTTATGYMSVVTGAKASVGDGLNLSVSTLLLGGVGQANGTWGSSSAPGASHQNDDFFSPTTGFLTVTTDTRPDTLVWRGTGDWFTNTLNWSNGIPGPGSNVWIASGTVTLTNPTPQLNEFVLGAPGVGVGATMLFTNWTTALMASNVTVLSNGTMTLPAAFSDSQMSNRVYLICTNFTLDAGG